jgi:hypothetical protein
LPDKSLIYDFLPTFANLRTPGVEPRINPAYIGLQLDG